MQASQGSIAQSLSWALHQGLERLESQWLLLHALGKRSNERAWLLAHDTDALSAETRQRFEQLAMRRAAGEPLSYLTGHQEFFGLDLRVDARVLVPRADTETLVQWVLDVLQPPSGCAPSATAPQVLDLGTGSGAIALAIAHARADVLVCAVDRSPDALAVARDNAVRLGLNVRFVQSSWLDQVQGCFDVIASNPPYVREGDPHLAALTHEPLQALTSGADGLADLRHLIAHAPAHLHRGGWLLLEHGYDQAHAVRELLRDAGFEEVQSRLDLSGIARCSGGRTARG